MTSDLTWDGLLAIANGSHERYHTLGRDDARALVTSTREHFAAQGPTETNQALQARLEAAEAEMWRIGYGGEVIDVLTEEGTGFTSHRGDLCWDTAENRARVRARYHALTATLDKVRAVRDRGLYVDTSAAQIYDELVSALSTADVSSGGPVLSTAGAPDAAPHLDGKWGPGQAPYTAGAPDAGEPHRCDCIDPDHNAFDPDAHSHKYATPPEPKGPEQMTHDEMSFIRSSYGHVIMAKFLRVHESLESDLAAANAQVEGTMNQLRSQERLTAAASARIADMQVFNDNAQRVIAQNQESAKAAWARSDRDLADANAALKAEIDAHGNTLRLLAAANARIAQMVAHPPDDEFGQYTRAQELEANLQAANDVLAIYASDIAAANARADAAEATAKALEKQVADGLTVRADLRARADAAERYCLDNDKVRRSVMTERDQLAARVRELEQANTALNDSYHEGARNQVTPEDRAVLDSWGALTDGQLEVLLKVGWKPEIFATVRNEKARREAKARRVKP